MPDDLATLTCGRLLRQFRTQAHPRPDELYRRPKTPEAERRSGITREELRARTAVSTRGIGAIECGEEIPTSDTIRVLADALDLSPEQRAAVETAARREREGQRAQQKARRMATPAAARSVSGPSRPPLVGRSQELDLLERHLTGEDAPPVLVLAGEPGIGKTRLLQETEARAVGSGWRVLRGGCQRRGGGMPYTPLLDALKRHVEALSPADLRSAVKECAGLARLLPELAAHPVVGASLVKGLPPWPLSPEQERRLMFAAVARFLANVAGPAGTLLLLDDLQWAGQDALDLLLSLLRAESNVPLRVAGAYRDSDAPPGSPLAGTLADLAHTGRVAHHALAPLSPAEAGQLFDLLAGDGEGGPGTDETRARAVRRCGGVPFYLVSLAQAPRQGEPNGSADIW